MKKSLKPLFDYFQAHDDACIILSEGDFVISDVVWRDAVVGLLANTEARLSVFYFDFSYDKKGNTIIEKPPIVNLEILRKPLMNWKELLVI